MSACYVYAIVDSDTSLPTVSAAELMMVPCRKLAAVTGRTVDRAARLTMEAVLHHEAVVEAVRRQGPALPVRFGTFFQDATSVASALAERYEPLAIDLDRLGDKVEVGLTALWAGPPHNAAPPFEEVATRAGQSAGARYLHARAARLQHDDALEEMARRIAREFDRALNGLALERRLSLLPTARIAVRAAYLLDPAGVSEIRRAVESVRRTRSDLRILLTGPWPPYSFVKQTAAEGGTASDGRLAALVQLLTEETRRRG